MFNILFTSTVMFDAPNITTGIDSIYNVAQPILNSLTPFMWWIIGAGVVFAVLKLIVGKFTGH